MSSNVKWQQLFRFSLQKSWISCRLYRLSANDIVAFTQISAWGENIHLANQVQEGCVCVWDRNDGDRKKIWHHERNVWSHVVVFRFECSTIHLLFWFPSIHSRLYSPPGILYNPLSPQFTFQPLSSYKNLVSVLLASFPLINKNFAHFFHLCTGLHLCCMFFSVFSILHAPSKYKC